MLNRRQALGAVAFVAAGAQAAPTLALNGGRPVREKPLKANYWGRNSMTTKSAPS